MTPDRSHIKNGPSKWHLILALFEPAKMPEVSFTFEADPTQEQRVIVLSVERTDIAGEEWVIECRYPAPRTRHFRMIYLTKNRRGMIIDSWKPEPHSHDPSLEELTQRVCDKPEKLFRQLFRAELERED